MITHPAPMQDSERPEVTGLAFSPTDFTIVLVLDFASITGGQAKVAIESAVGLKQAGFNVVYFAACGPVDPKLQASGARVVCLDQPDLLGNASRASAALQGIWNRPAAEALENLLATLPSKKTLVHVHGWAKALSPSIGKAIRKSGLPAVYTLHEYFLFCPNGGFYNYRTETACKLAPMSIKCISTHCDSRHYAHKLWRVARQGAASLSGLAGAFQDAIYLTELARMAVAPYMPPNLKLHHIPNPVDAVDQGPKDNPASGEILFVGRLAAEKGPLLFAEAARRAGCIPVFAGNGPVEDEIRRHYPEAKMLGWQSAENVRRLMREARALVFPSMWYETFGLTAYEALAVGTPVIVSDGCAAREAVRDGVNGLHFANGDADDFAAKLRIIADDPLLSRLSKAAYEGYWKDPPDLKKHIAKLSALYFSRLVA